MNRSSAVKPFLKWAGGKSQLLAQFEPLLPASIKGYHEPFMGSAALFFYLCNVNRLPRRARLADSNSELVNTFTVLRDHPDDLIARLAHHKRRHSQSHYYIVRAQAWSSLSPLERAARFIYLNKTCYNGLYRVNRSGQFNVPFGSYKNPSIFSEPGLRQASECLQRAELQEAPFQAVTSVARRGDFVYFDPPYHPLSKTANFTSYTAAEFGEAQQRELAEVFKTLHRKGCKVMLSNSWTPLILDLYQGFTLLPVLASRAINSNGAGRGRIKEAVVLNYTLGVPPAARLNR